MMIHFGMRLCAYCDETHSEVYGEAIDCRSEAEAVEVFEFAKAYLNSMECNHDQLDRGE